MKRLPVYRNAHQRARGRVTAAERSEICAAREAGYEVEQICAAFGRGRSTIYQILADAAPGPEDDWSPEERRDAIRMNADGDSPTTIGRRLGRSAADVRRMLEDWREGRSLEVAPERPLGLRNCLRCDGLFRSQGPHNRMCNGCRRETSGGMDDYRVAEMRP